MVYHCHEGDFRRREGIIIRESDLQREICIRIWSVSLRKCECGSYTVGIGNYRSFDNCIQDREVIRIDKTDVATWWSVQAELFQLLDTLVSR
jgi:hypothetical protein